MSGSVTDEQDGAMLPTEPDGDDDDDALRDLLNMRGRAPPAAIAPGQVIGEAFKVERTLGAGGMGVVYLARDLRLRRAVAIKLHAAVVAEGGERLLREASALAQLVHPNVVTVYEVGAWANHPYVAMEYVEGGTARGWLSAQPRTAREIVALYTAAGRGLAAAHAAGLVHRDFKPDNVLVGDDGRVRVADFGLARLFDTGEVPTSDRLDEDALPVLTATGAAMGTPAYMAPEQHAREPVGPAADQFAFAVALWEALAGERPFAGDTIRAIREAIAGPPRAPTAGRLPAHVQRALTRALDRDPAARFPSMTALLDALARDPGPRRTRIAIGAVVVVGVAALGAGAMWLGSSRDRPDVCAGARTASGDTWTAARRAAIHDAFARSGRPYAEATFLHVADAIDRYQTAWTAQRVDACRATSVRRDQPAELQALRDACLDRREVALGGALTALEAADASTVDRAIDVVPPTRDLDACRDTARLGGIVAPPTDPDHRRAYDAALADAARAKALDKSGHFDDSLEAATSAVASADASGDPDARAIAREQLAYATVDQDPAAARDTIEEGARLAAEAHDDVLAARLWISDVNVLTAQLSQLDEAVRMRAVAEAAAARAGSSLDVDVALAEAVGKLEHAQGHLPEARKSLEHAIELLDAQAPGIPRIASILAGLGAVQADQEDFAAAHHSLERAEQVLVEAYGPEHPRIGVIRSNEGDLLMAEGKYADARASYQAALDIKRAVYGADSADAAKAMHNLAGAIAELGDDATAVAMEQQVLTILEAKFGPDSPPVALVLDNLAGSEASLGDLASAVKHLERALVIERDTQGDDNPDLAETLRRLGDFRSRLGDLAGGLRDLEQARALLIGAGQGESRVAAIVEGTLGNLLRRAGKTAEALTSMQAAVRIAAKALDPNHVELAEHRGNLAAALDDAGRHTEARPEAVRGLAIADANGGGELSGQLLGILGQIDLHLGDLAAAKDELTRSLAVLADAEDPSILAEPLTLLAEVELALHDAAGAQRDAQRATDLRAKSTEVDPVDAAETARVLARAKRANR